MTHLPLTVAVGVEGETRVVVEDNVTASVSRHLMDTGDWEFLRLRLNRGLNYVRAASWKTSIDDLSASTAIGRTVFHFSGEYSVETILEVEGALVAMHLQPRRELVHITIATQFADHGRVPAIESTLREVFPSSQEEDRVPVVFWYNTPHDGPKTARRRIDAEEWSEAAGNYTATTQQALDGLVRGFRPAKGGQLLLWHGEPGTGKTTALRILGSAWKSWCSFEFVTDPEELLADAQYLTHVLLDGGQADMAWRLLVMEDTGELLVEDAKQREGQRLSRLLNVVDGLIGRGLKILILSTTNEPFGSLHKAVSRPGRCASVVEFLPLSYEESALWLKRHGIDDPPEMSEHTLADLYAISSGQFAARPRRRPIGFHRDDYGPD